MNKYIYRLLPVGVLLIISAACNGFSHKYKDVLEINDLREYVSEEAMRKSDDKPAPRATQRKQEAQTDPLPPLPDLLPVGGSWVTVFNDSNRYQYAHAERIGIEPLDRLEKAYYTSRPIVKVESGENFVVDKLDHSVPFLVPEAALLLNDIGAGFRDSLKRRGLGDYRIIVTSVLRTPASVKKLRRINGNATDSSTHKFATTFDITYARFAGADSIYRSEQLKNLLGRVIYDLRKQGRCLVKYERKSPCFHITVTSGEM